MDLAPGDRAGVGFDPGHVQQVLDNFMEPSPALMNGPQHVPLLVAETALQGAGEEFGAGEDVGQRGAQFVGGEGDEIAFEAFGLLQRPVGQLHPPQTLPQV